MVVAASGAGGKATSLHPMLPQLLPCIQPTPSCRSPSSCCSGFGLLASKACKACADDNCITCDGNVRRCTLCYSGHAPDKNSKCIPW